MRLASPPTNRLLATMAALLPWAAPQSDMATKLRDPRLLLLHAAEFDPRVEVPTLPEALTWSREEQRAAAVDSANGLYSDYFVVQFIDRVTPADRATLAELGVEAIAYVPNNAYLVRTPAAALPAFASWPRVRALVPFQPAYRIDLDLLAGAASAGDAPLEVLIELFRGCDSATATRELVELGVELDEPDAGFRTRLLARLPANRLTALAHVRDVQWIAPLSQLVRRGAVPLASTAAGMAAPLAPLPNDTTTWVIQSDVSGSTPVWANGVLGDGVIIGHIDGALDLAACWFNDPAVSAPDPTHRKVVSHHGSYTNSDSHGTHTAGSAAGDQEPINGVLGGNGTAYHARLAHTNDSLVNSSNFKSKLEELYSDGATIFTNSWGDDFTTAYNAWCVDIDAMMWEHQETLICFAVSNGSLLKNPENAKNVLAVGATEQSPNEGRHCTAGAGPTADGRRKPELFAPGCNIQSVNDGRSCSTTSMSGTSMACPAIAGAAALTKSYFEAGYWPSGAANAVDAFAPSGSLLKAVLINSGRDMAGESGYPTNIEGWGRLLLDHSLYFAGDARKLWVTDPGSAGAFSSSGDERTEWINVYANTSELNLCLVFPDAPGTLNSSSPVVNDLDLEVVTPNGTLYRGNVFSGGFSTTGGSTDPLNNVERVRLQTPPLGWYAVTVRANNIASSSAQSYAMVASGNLDPPAIGGFTTYGSGTAGTGGLVPTATLSGSPNLDDDVTLTIGNGRGGAAALLILGFARASTPFVGGQLLVATPWVIVPLVLDGTPGASGDGDVVVTDTLPADPALVGVIVDFQAVIADPAALQKLALSNGAEMTIGS